MNDFLPMTQADAETLGFFRLPRRNALFAHPRMPGFLFRLVSNLDEAIACGGLTAVGQSYSASYFGLDLLSVIRAGKLGEFGKPKAFEARAAAGLLPSYEARSDGSNQTRRYGSLAHVELDLEWTNFGTGGKYIGLVTKADRGLVVDQGLRSGKSALTPITTVPLSVANDILMSYGPAGDGKWKYGHPMTPINLHLPMVSGFIQRAIPVPKRDFLTRAKPGFIAEIEANDSIKRAYGAALDELIASAAGNTHDEFRIYPIAGETNKVIRWSIRRRDMAVLTQQNGGLSDPFEGIFKDTDGPANGDTTAIVPSADMRSRTGVLDLTTTEKSREGFPCPFWIMGHWWYGAGVRVLGEGLEITRLPDGTFALKDTEAFSLDEIGFDKVLMAPNSELPASSVFGPISPRVRPGSAPTGSLDASARVEDEMRLRSANLRVGLPNAGGTATAQEQAASASEAALDIRDSEMEWFTPFLSEFAGYIVNTVRELDKRARKKLKG